MSDYYYRFNLTRKCKKCSLATGKAVTGQSEVPFNQVKLIVISSYPGKAEEVQNLSLAPETKRRRSKDQTPAGVFIRRCFKYIFDTDEEIDENYKPFERYIYFTNAIKCKKKDETVKQEHRSMCKQTWLDKELILFNSKTPILLAGSDPVKSILGESHSIFKNRNKVNYYKSHPVVVCENPINIEKGMIRKLTTNQEEIYEKVKALVRSKINPAKKNKLLENIIKTESIPISFGMSNYFFKEDMLNIKNEVKKFLYDYN